MSQNNKIWLSLAHMGGYEQKFIQEAFDNNWVVPLGPNVDGFESDLDLFLGGEKHIVALSSGTAAIHLALIQLGIQPGDEIICQSFTFSASANPIKYLGANPVFVDSDKDTWNIDPFLLEIAIEDRIKLTGKTPKAMIPVHLYGMPAKMDEIMAISNKYGIPVLEDAAEALGSKYKGNFCGTFGHFACLSFNGNKIITTSGGGALVCTTQEEADKTKFLATQARDSAPHYQHSHIGYNYRLSNICAGIGRGQMLVLDNHINARREINNKYINLFKDIPGISFHKNPNTDFESNMWLTCIIIDTEITGFSREDLRLAMEAANIETRPLWKPMHLQPIFRNYPFYGNGDSSRKIGSQYFEASLPEFDNSTCGILFRDGLCLPSHPGLSEFEIMRVVDVIKKCSKIKKVGN